MPGTLSLWCRRLRARLRSLFAAKPSAALAEWRKGPKSLRGERAVLFVTYAPQGTLTTNARHQIMAWRRENFTVVTIVIVDSLGHAQERAYLGDQIVVRQNIGYDFGAWASVIEVLPDIRNAEILVLANDSVYGPTKRFSQMIRRVEQSQSDIISATDSYEQTYHIQSYLVFFKRRALQDKSFVQFWNAVRIGNRQHVIDLYETTMARYFRRAGLSVEALYPSPKAFQGNRTLTDWRGLLDEGFPFIKAQLVRENPFSVEIGGWPERLAMDGYDSTIAVADLARRRAAGR